MRIKIEVMKLIITRIFKRIFYRFRYRRCQIDPETKIGKGTKIRPFTVIEESVVIGEKCIIGPFTRLRPGTILGNNVHIGNFVEVKNTIIGDGSKANHLTYLGDTEIGKNVNIGAGTITCNFDGKKKHKTIIEDGVFIGSNVSLIAPVRIGKNAYVAAGSTITENAPSNALAIARARQINKPNWVKKKKRS